MGLLPDASDNVTNHKGGPLNIKKPLLVLGAVTGIGLAGVTSIGVASATANSSGTDSIIDRISTKFNLNKDEVQAVFEEERAAREAEHAQKMEDRLTAAVAEGKLTEEQKAKIIAKLEELKASREGWNDKAPEERKATKQHLHEDLEQWAEDNNIPTEYLMFRVHKFTHHGPGMHKILE